MSVDVYVELEVEGPSDQSLGFVAGYRAALGDPRPVWCSGTVRFELESFRDSLRDRMHLESHFVLPRDLAEDIVAAIETSEALKIRPGSMVVVDYAELEFDYRCFNPDDGAALRRVVEEDLPAGVRLEGYAFEEHRDESARGVELYAPTHHYTLKGQGRYVGPVAGIFSLAERLRDQDFVHPEKVRLHRV